MGSQAGRTLHRVGRRTKLQCPHKTRDNTGTPKGRGMTTADPTPRAIWPWAAFWRSHLVPYTY